MPDRPFFKEKRNSSLPIPIEEMTPTPVMQMRSTIVLYEKRYAPPSPPFHRGERDGVRGEFWLFLPADRQGDFGDYLDIGAWDLVLAYS